MKGKCVNLDCPEFDKIVDIPDGEDFVCKNCGHKLHEVSGTGGTEGPVINWLKEHKLLSVIVAILVIGGIVAWLLLAKEAPHVTDPTDINIE